MQCLLQNVLEFDPPLPQLLALCESDAAELTAMEKLNAENLDVASLLLVPAELHSLIDWLLEIFLVLQCSELDVPVSAHGHLMVILSNHH